LRKFSLIIPIYRVEDFVESCVRSVLDQTFQDFECIIVDDGSPDRSAQRAKDAIQGDARFSIVHQANQGLSSARNHGLDLASGEFVLFLDGDDYLDRTALGRIADKVSPVAPQVLFFETVEFEHETGNVAMGAMTGSIDLPVSLDGTIFSLTDSNNLGPDRLYRLPIPAWSRCYRLDYIKTFRFPLGRYFEDNPLFYFMACTVTQAAILREKIYYYRIRQGSITQPTTKEKGIKYVEDMRAVLEISEQYLVSLGRPDLLSVFRRQKEHQLKSTEQRYLPKSRKDWQNTTIGRIILNLVPVFIFKILSTRNLK